MKFIILASLVALTLGYEDMSDKYNYDTYLNNVDLLQKHLDCYLDKTPCTDSETLSVKPHLKEIFSDACHECSPMQKHHGHVFLTALKSLLPEGYVNFLKKYDPDGKKSNELIMEVDKF